MTPEQKVAEFKKIVEEMANLYEQKNKNYGDSFGELYKELGPTAGLVPLWNKLHRATSLIKGNKNNFESLEDTFKDLACYAIMNLIALKEEKNLTSEYTIAPHVFPNTELAENNLGTGTAITTTDRCKDCWVRKQLDTEGVFVGDMPCQWCHNNEYRLTCFTSGKTYTSSLSATGDRKDGKN
jgi:hypothetical protein